MAKIPISVQQDFLDRVGAAASIKAVSELIWNGFDAFAKTVDVSFKITKIDGLEDIQVKDDGLGHDFHKVGHLPENDDVRYTISESACNEVLKRLAKFNEERWEEGEAAGLHKEVKK